MIINGMRIRCPKCDWEPDETCIWMCDECRTQWNTFETHAKCPGCGKVFEDTQCLRSKGGCGQMSPNVDWYIPFESIENRQNKKFVWFWQKKEEPPITVADKEWVEESLLWLADLFTPEVFRSLATITPDRQYFDRVFTGTEEDVDYILHKVAEVMNIKPWEIQLMFFSEQPTRFSEGISASPSKNLKDSWSAKKSKLVDKGFGHKEIWIEMGQLNDPVSLIASIAVELANYKLAHEYRIEDDLALLADLTSLVFGFGIFRANAYFKFSQWQGNRYQGWQMQKRGGLPEPVIAYVMAWLAHYRNEDISWKPCLNRTAKKYFDQSYCYIHKNADSMKWSS